MKEKTVNNPKAIKAIVLLTAFAAMLNETSVNVALSNLMDVFNVSVDTIQWLVTGFMLVMAVVVPVTAYIIQTFSDRKIYFASLVLLLIGSALNIAASRFGMLFIGRLIQAVGTCCLMTLTVNIMLNLSSRKNRGAAMGLIGLVTLFAPAIAPSLAGGILQVLSWRWIFIVPVPILVILGIAAIVYLEDVTPILRQSLDQFSVVIEAFAFGGLLYGVSGISKIMEGSGTSYIVGFAVGAVALVGFIFRQLSLKHPLLNLHVFKSPMYSIGMLAIFFCILTGFGVTILLPILFQDGFALSVAIAGMALLPGGVLNGLSAPLFGKLYDKIGPRIPTIGGMSIVLLSIFAFAFIPSSTHALLYVVIHIVCLVAISMVMTVSQANGMNHVEPHLYPHGTAIMNTLIQLGGGFGSAIYVAMFSLNSSKAEALDFSVAVQYGFHSAFLVGGIIFFIPFLASFFIKDNKQLELEMAL